MLGPVHALFQRRVAGDDALLELAALRFAQMGLAAEVYAYTPDEFEHVLRFVPPHPDAVSFTLEIHQVEGRLPLADASRLLARWQDITSAERMNYWLSVLGENALLVSQRLAGNM
jgi:hypothetical protein